MDRRWQRLKTLSGCASRLPAEARSQWLADLRGEDAAVRTEIASLLDAEGRAGAFLERPALAAPHAAHAVIKETRAFP